MMPDRRPEHGLVLKDVRITRGAQVLFAVDCTVRPAEILTLMGPSGVGKSTLLAFIAGFLGSDFRAQGKVILNGRDITGVSPEQRGVGLLFQDALLFPHLSVAGNLLVGLHPDMKGRRFRREAVTDALTEVGLAGFADRDPATLSGGQAARVALLRTLLSRPEALLLDEPFSRLDATLRAEVREFVFVESRKRSLPVLLVTHDPADAAAAAGPVLQLASRDRTREAT